METCLFTFGQDPCVAQTSFNDDLIQFHRFLNDTRLPFPRFNEIEFKIHANLTIIHVTAKAYSR